GRWQLASRPPLIKRPLPPQKVPGDGRKFAGSASIAASRVPAYKYDMPLTATRAALACALALLLEPGLARAQGGTLRVAVPATLDPALASETSSGLLARQLFDSLLQYREGSSDVEPALAAQWRVSR